MIVRYHALLSLDYSSAKNDIGNALAVLAPHLSQTFTPHDVDQSRAGGATHLRAQHQAQLSASERQVYRDLFLRCRGWCARS
jgi:hypothetical protein